MKSPMPRLDRVVRHENPFWEYREDRYRMPSGREGRYFYVHSRGSAMVIPVTSRGTVVMVRQFRYLNQRWSLELPAGGIEDGTTARETAVAELAQEAGLRARELDEVGHFNPCNGMTDELCTVFLARELSPTSAPQDESEAIEVVELNRDAIASAITSGELWDGMTLAAWSVFGNVARRVVTCR